MTHRYTTLVLVSGPPTCDPFACEPAPAMDYVSVTADFDVPVAAASPSAAYCRVPERGMDRRWGSVVRGEPARRVPAVEDNTRNSSGGPEVRQDPGLLASVPDLRAV